MYFFLNSNLNETLAFCTTHCCVPTLKSANGHLPQFAKKFSERKLYFLKFTLSSDRLIFL